MSGKLVWVMFGSGWGSQIMLVANENETHVWGWKWRNQGRKWTGRVKISKADIRREVSDEDMKTAKVRRALQAAETQLAIRKLK